jgi:hypothetical protein
MQAINSFIVVFEKAVSVFGKTRCVEKSMALSGSRGMKIATIRLVECTV